MVHRQGPHGLTAVSSLVVAKGTAKGGSYRFVDRGVRVTSDLRYHLQVIHANGTRTWFRPVGVG